MARGVYSTANWFEPGSAIITAEPLTIACWVNVSSVAALNNFVGIPYTSGAGTARTGWYLYSISTTGVIAAAKAENSTAGIAASTALTLNTWTHAAGVFVSNTSRFGYRDGVVGTENTTSIVHTVTVDETVIGVMKGLGNTTFWAAAALIAEVGIWNVALTGAEILQLSLGYSPLFVRPESLVAYYPLIRGDASGDEPDYVGGLKMVEQGTVAVATHPRVFYPSSPIKLGVPAAAAPPAGNPWYAWQQM